MGNRGDLLVELVRTGFKIRYNNSVLGFLWVLFKPLMLFATLYIVFSQFKLEGVEHYAIFLLIGIILYDFFREGIFFGMASLRDKSHIILKVNFPREIALMSSIILAVINVFVNIIILIVFLLMNSITISLSCIVYFIFLILVITTMVYAISFFLSIMCLKLHDLPNIVEILLQLGFYLTPIIFPMTFLPEKLSFLPWLKPRTIIAFNPLTIIIESAREALIYARIINLFPMFLILGGSLIVLLCGHMYFRKNIKKVTELF